METARLTPNGVVATLAGDLNLKPVLQVLNLRSIAVNGLPGSAPRFRVVVSDGAAMTTSLLAAQRCATSFCPASSAAAAGSIVQLTEYLVNNVNGKKVELKPNDDQHEKAYIEAFSGINNHECFLMADDQLY